VLLHRPSRPSSRHLKNCFRQFVPSILCHSSPPLYKETCPVCSITTILRRGVDVPGGMRDVNTISQSKSERGTVGFSTRLDMSTLSSTAPPAPAQESGKEQIRQIQISTTRGSQRLYVNWEIWRKDWWLLIGCSGGSYIFKKVTGVCR
jgi:hypothetical protein